MNKIINKIIKGLKHNQLPLICVTLSLAGQGVYALDLPETTPMSKPTFVSPYYFGPNAFPIPDILVRTGGQLKIELAGDYFYGKKSHTSDVFLKADIPLWTSRANLSLWWPAIEWYDNSTNRGHMSGDVYLSINMQLLEESVRRPSWTLRAAIKTASGGGYEIARYYDCPGYFFDTYFGKIFRLGSAGIQICGGGGFLCWQTANGRQNDAIQYGLLVGLHLAKFSVSESFGGYCGWESSACNDGHLAHDRPMSLKTRIAYNIDSHWQINAMVQHGLMDYPYTQIHLGIAYSIDILRHKK